MAKNRNKTGGGKGTNGSKVQGASKDRSRGSAGSPKRDVLSAASQQESSGKHAAAAERIGDGIDVDGGKINPLRDPKEAFPDCVGFKVLGADDAWGDEVRYQREGFIKETRHAGGHEGGWTATTDNGIDLGFDFETPEEAAEALLERADQVRAAANGGGFGIGEDLPEVNDTVVTMQERDGVPYPTIEGIESADNYDSAYQLAYWQHLHAGLPTQKAADNAARDASVKACDDVGSRTMSRKAFNGFADGRDAAMAVLYEDAPEGMSVYDYLSSSGSPGIRKFGPKPLSSPDDVEVPPNRYSDGK